MIPAVVNREKSVTLEGNSEQEINELCVGGQRFSAALKESFGRHTLVCSSWVCASAASLRYLFSFPMTCAVVLPESHAQVHFHTALPTTYVWAFLFQPFLQLKVASAALHLPGSNWIGTYSQISLPRCHWHTEEGTELPTSLDIINGLSVGRQVRRVLWLKVLCACCCTGP